jgi:threonine dehydrogenase-like Zn-dependent dehydrogenase
MRPGHEIAGVVAALGEAGISRLRELRQQEAVDVVFESVGCVADTVVVAMHSVRPRGRVALLGVFTTPRVSVGGFDLLLLEIGLYGAVVYGAPEGGRPHYAQALDVVAGFATEARSLVTHHFPLAEVCEAFATAADESMASIKVHVNPG